MIEWSNRIITDKGPINLKTLTTTMSGYKVTDLYRKEFRATELSTENFSRQVKNFRIIPDEKLRVLNERGVYEELEYIYFFGSSEVSFDVSWFIREMVRITNRNGNIFSITCSLSQKFLLMGKNKNMWKSVTEFGSIGDEWSRIMTNVEDIHIAEYIGLVKSYRKSNFVGIKVKDSLGVCLYPGIVVHSGA